MSRFHKILVPVDLSEYSREVLREAADLARTIGAAIVVLHVIEPTVPTTAYVTPMLGYSESYQEVNELARAYLDSLHPMVKGLSHEWFLRSGETGEEILACARDTGADLIVMATHGRSGISRLVMGSTAEAVMRHADIPVMTWRAAALKPAPSAPDLHPSPASPISSSTA